MCPGRIYPRLGIRNQERLIALRAALRKIVREAPPYNALWRTFDRTQWYSRKELEQFQRDGVRELLLFAESRVPFYREILQDLDVAHDDPLEVLRRLPIMDKPLVRAAGTELMSEGHRLAVSGGTSGSTGSPLRLRHDLRSVVREGVFSDRQLAWAGYQRGEPRAWWRGDLVVPANTRQGPLWRANRAQNMLMLSSYHLSEETIESYRVALEQFDPVVIQAYPSSIGFLARYLESTGQVYRGKRLRGVITSSETLLDEQRASINRTMPCRVFDWYGGYERVAAIGTCEYGTLHLLSDYSYVELPEAGDETCGLIGTAFFERAMPLIRYRTDDFVELGDNAQLCQCGREFPQVRRIAGRTGDSIRTPDGRVVASLDHLFKGIDFIAEAQIRQDKLDEVDIAVVPLAGFGDAEKNAILHKAHERLGHSVTVSIVTVESLPRTANGKLRPVICSL